MVQRLAKGVLPPNTQIQKDAIQAMSKGATVFISHVADKANELTLATNKKTITPQNVLEALSECEFEDFLPRVKAELDKFNEIAMGKRNEYRKKIKEKEMGASPNGNQKKHVNGDETTVNGDGRMEGREDDNGEERARKRVRREDSIEGTEKEHGQGQRQVPASATPEDEDGEERYDTAMEDDGAGANEQESPEGEVVQEGSDDEDEEVSEDEVEDEEDVRDASQVDMDNRLNLMQDGLSSGVEDDDEESD
ncbi:MAG: hypothetical protein Q9209_003354 [Squamulea sp. 1 TL-2023]